MKIEAQGVSELIFVTSITGGILEFGRERSKIIGDRLEPPLCLQPCPSRADALLLYSVQ